MAYHRFVAEYDRQQEDWTSYKERLREYFIANMNAAAKNCAILLNVIRVSTYQLTRSLVAPAKLMEEEFSDSVRLVQVHY